MTRPAGDDGAAAGISLAEGHCCILGMIGIGRSSELGGIEAGEARISAGLQRRINEAIEDFLERVKKKLENNKPQRPRDAEKDEQK